ncbi:HD domain-containing phosphohydrolase [Thiobaca trueperi]|uniref:PAS domain S-box-containing protein n=1 Tax=Thiobaca trueperi TaxID=127458 RepID=A0A4R3MQY3_9GAMM|nr:HD domain-containing phosphohydrolase [Thiobaca trueperi]TCT18718.1 PAS domain S-box-containing protein [Thiobaca trueperi]
MKKHIQIALAVLVISMGLGLSGILLFSEAEKERDVQILQAQMNLVADSRAEAVHGWLEAQYDVLSGLAQNESLQLYTAVVGMSGAGQPFEEDPAQLTYLRTLLTATAERSGFLSPSQQAEALPANVKPLGLAGLALVDPEGKIIVATNGLPPIQGQLAQFLRQTPLTERGFLDLHPGPTGQPTLGFVVPVFAQQGEEGASVVIARILGLRPVDERFFATLKQPGATAATAESYLIRRSGHLIDYLSPLLDGSAPLTKRLAINTPGLVDAAALHDPGRFHVGRNGAAKESFAVSRRIGGTDWVLVHQIDRAEALAASDARRTALVSVLALILVVFGAALIVVWRVATSQRAEEAARRFRLSSERFEMLSRFLDVVTDSQPHPILVADASNALTFANRRTAEVSGIPEEELSGRSLVGVLGHDKGIRYNAINQRVLETGQALIETSCFEDDEGGEQVWRSYHCLFVATPDQPPSVLMTIEDLTDLVRERARRERNTRQLIETLVGLVDERDPDSAHQSRYVALVARRIAEEMGLADALIEATDQAARLVNIGKIRIPRSLLTRQGSLTEAELTLVRAAMDAGPELLKEIEFEGPVIETLRQMNEWVDGSGRPAGLSGDAILPSAQAVALANCFVALLSPRAFRDGKSFDEAEAILMREIDRRFDRRAVLSLLNYLNNRGGREAWAMMSQRDG